MQQEVEKSQRRANLTNWPKHFSSYNAAKMASETQASTSGKTVKMDQPDQQATNLKNFMIAHCVERTL